MIGLLIFLGTVLCFVLFLIIKGKTLKGSRVHSDVNIPDGEFLHYVNYFEGKKYADLYIVTEKVANANGGFNYRAYIDAINVSESRKPSSNYKTWPSFSMVDPKLGSTVESKADVPNKILNNWVAFEDLAAWHIKMDYKNRKGEYTLKFVKDGVTNEVKNDLKKLNPKVPSTDMWGTFFLQSRFVDYQSKGIQATINPVYLPLPAKYTYTVAAKETMQTKAGSFPVLKYTTSAFISLVSTPEVLSMVFRFAPRPGQPVRKAAGPFAVYVEDSDRRLTVKMENTAGLGGDYILEEVSDVKSHKLFQA